MRWLNFLHFYQPITQQFDVLEAVIAQSYLPIFKKIDETSDTKLTINISGSLLELFDKFKYHSLIDLIGKSVQEGKVELVSSCKYHALIPLIPLDELDRQIYLNNETLKSYFGNDLKLSGFFPPEMAVCSEMFPIISKYGFKWIIADEISYTGGKSGPSTDKIYTEKSTGIKILYRDRRVSNLIMAAVVRTSNSLRESMKDDFENKKYLVTAMDGETFGHHRPGLESLLFDIMRSELFGTQKVSDFLEEATHTEEYETEDVDVYASTWASSVGDIESGNQFLSWKDSENFIHTNQWQFLFFALNLVKNVPKTDPNYEIIRKKMDIALASDHFWWACAKPWWSLEMIEDGAFKLLDVVKSLSNIDKTLVDEARTYYQNIVSTAFEWQRSGKIREINRQRSEALRIPFKERTLEQGGNEAAIYNAFIDMIKEQEKLAVVAREYEKALLWRDALYKLENKLDIFETINAIDLLRVEVGNGYVERTLDKYTEKFRLIRGGQPEQRD